MSWLFSRALVEVFSEATCSDGAQYALSSGNPTPQAFLPPDRMTAFSRPSRFGMTFAPLTDDLGEGLLTWFRVDFLAKTSASLGTETDWTASDPASGPKWRGSLARYDPDLRSWKTAQRSLLGDSDEFSETWPRWGTTVGGELYLLPTPALPTSGSESGYWHTPTCHNAKEGGYPAEWLRKTPSLAAEAMMGMPSKMWPTPQASDNRDRGHMSMPSIQRRVRLGKQIMLSMAVKPDGDTAGMLNPTWVEWLMGWPLGWTDLQPLETDKFHKQWHSHGEH